MNGDSPATARSTPRFTTVVGVDEAHLAELRLVWPTWQRYRPEILASPLLLVCDAQLEAAQWEERLAFLQHPCRQIVTWAQDGVEQREKMLSGLVFCTARHVTTPWYLKLDTDTVAVAPADWIDNAWFEPNEHGELPAFIASPWGYTKPADAILRLDQWADGIAELASHPRLNLIPTPGSALVAHRRIISWCFFGNTAHTRAAAALCGDRLPVPSQDTFLWYVAHRRGDFYRRVAMQRFGWEHVYSYKRLRRACEYALTQPYDPPQQVDRSLRRAPSPTVAGALARVASALVPSGARGILADPIGNRCLQALNHLRPDWQVAVDGPPGPVDAAGDAGIDCGSRASCEALDFVVLEAEVRQSQLTRLMQQWWERLRPGGFLAGINYGHPRDRRGTWGIRRAVDDFARRVASEVILPGETVWVVPKLAKVAQGHRPEAAGTPLPAARSGRLVAITSLFNPQGDVRLDRNYDRFARALADQGVDLWTAEVAYGETPFRLPPRDDRVLPLRGDGVLWQKERALNLVSRILPPDVDYIAWVDGDVVFTDHDWSQKLIAALQTHPVVQCWSGAEFLDAEGGVDDYRWSSAWVASQGHPEQQSFACGHPGLAWAVRREILGEQGLYDRHITGSGDTLIAIASFGWWQHPAIARLPPGLQHDFLDWGRRWSDSVRGQVGVVPGLIRHLWHGALENRLYHHRGDWLLHHDFDPARDLIAAEGQLWQWTGRNRPLQQRLEAYFRWLRFSDTAPPDELARLAREVGYFAAEVPVTS